MTWRVLLILTPLLTVACSDSPTAPTTTTPTTTTLAPYTTFQGTLSPLGTSVYPFTASKDGDVVVQLSALNSVGQRAALPVALLVSVGTLVDEGCEPQQSLHLTPTLVSQFGVQVTAGAHCLSVQDDGVLSGDASFVVRFRYP